MKTSAKKQTAKDFVPTPMKKVLIALDIEPSAQKVAETGYSLAKSMKAEVVLLHIIGGELAYYSSLGYSPIMGYTGFGITESPNLIALDNIKESSTNFLEKSKQHLGDTTIQTLVEEGDTADVILQTATELHADIIVVGTHSRRGLEKILMGSVAEKVFHHTSIPLFLVPTRKDKR